MSTDVKCQTVNPGCVGGRDSGADQEFSCRDAPWELLINQSITVRKWRIGGKDDFQMLKKSLWHYLEYIKKSYLEGEEVKQPI